MTVADAHVSAGSGIAHLPAAPSTLARSGEGRHKVSSPAKTYFVFKILLSESVQKISHTSTLKHCMWKNRPSVSMFMAAPLPSGWEHPEHNRFPLTHLRMYAHGGKIKRHLRLSTVFLSTYQKTERSNFTNSRREKGFGEERHLLPARRGRLRRWFFCYIILRF